MTTYKTFLKEYVEAWNSQDVERMLSFYTDDVNYVDQAVGVDLDRNGTRGFLKKFIGNYSVGFKVTPTFLCEDPASETWSYEWDVEGTSTEGIKMFIKGISMIQMRGDKILRNVDYWDYADSPKGQVNQKN